ncbi:MAG: alpha/beta hydrolase [Bacteroidota bacterium]
MKNILIACLLISTLFACQKESTELTTNINDRFWLKHKGAEMPIVVEGNATSKTFVILLHGGPGGNSVFYNRQATDFSDKIEQEVAMVYYDQRAAGSARGNLDESTLTVAQLVEDLEKLVELLHLRYGEDIKIVLAGNSWGGFLGFAFLVKDNNQDKVAAWIEIDGINDYELNLKFAIAEMRTVANQMIAENVLVDEWSNVLDRLSVYDTATVSVADRGKVYDVIDRAEFLLRSGGQVKGRTVSGTEFDARFKDNYNVMTRLSHKFSSAQQVRRDAYTVKLIPQLRKLTLPTLFIWGEYDVRDPIAEAELAYEQMSTPESQKEIVIIEAADHYVFVRQPEKVADTMIEFIQEHMQ